MPSIISPNPAPEQPTDHVRGIAADIAAYAGEPYSSLPAYALGWLKGAAQAVTDDASPRNLAHLSDVLAGIELAEQQHRAELAQRRTDAERHLAEIEAQDGAR